MSLQIVTSRPPVLAGDIMRRAREEKVLDFDLGALALDGPGTRAFFEEMAELKATQYLGFKFTCSLTTGIASDDAALLASGGLTRATLVPAERSDSAQADPPLHLTMLESVRTLFEAGLDVEWDLRVTEALARPGARDELLATMAAAHNLPPPSLAAERDSGFGSADFTEQLQASVAAWRSNFRKSALTYARGPGFMRIRDRRSPDRRWMFYTLKGRQSDLLLFCTTVRSAQAITDAAQDIPPERLSAYLDRMVSSGLMCRHGAFYLSLPTRRTLEERWSSEVL